jgi:hypothetical protein
MDMEEIPSVPHRTMFAGSAIFEVMPYGDMIL